MNARVANANHQMSPALVAVAFYVVTVGEGFSGLDNLGVDLPPVVKQVELTPNAAIRVEDFHAPLDIPLPPGFDVEGGHPMLANQTVRVNAMRAKSMRFRSESGEVSLNITLLTE